MVGFRLINKDDNLVHLECVRSNFFYLPANSADTTFHPELFPPKTHPVTLAVHFPFSELHQIRNPEKDIKTP